MFPVEPHVKPYVPFPADPKFETVAYSPGGGTDWLLLVLVVASLWLAYCSR